MLPARSYGGLRCYYHVYTRSVMIRNTLLASFCPTYERELGISYIYAPVGRGPTDERRSVLSWHARKYLDTDTVMIYPGTLAVGRRLSLAMGE